MTIRSSRLGGPGLPARLGPVSRRPRLIAGVLAAVLVQVALALTLADQRWTPAVAACAVLALALVAVIEPRVTFCAPLFFLLLVIIEHSRVTAADAVIVLPLVVVGCSALTGGEIAGRAVAIWRAVPFKLALVLFIALVVVAVAKGYSSVGPVGPLQSLRLAIAPVLLLAVAVFRDRRDLLNGVRLTFYAFIVYAFLQGVYNAATGASVANAGVSTGGTRAVANSTAMFLAMGLILVGFHLAREDRLVRRVGLSALMGMALVGIGLALARTTWLALAAVLLVLLVFTPEARRGTLRFLALAAPVILLLALIAPLAAPAQLHDIEQRVSQPTGQGQDESAVFREQAWGLMMKRFDESPVFGRGFGQSVSFVTNDKSTVVVTNDPHNGFIYLLVGMGVVGLAAFAIIQLGFLRTAARALRLPGARDLAIWSAAAWVIYMVNAFTGVLLGEEALMLFLWILLSIPIALVALPERAGVSRP